MAGESTQVSLAHFSSLRPNCVDSPADLVSLLTSPPVRPFRQPHRLSLSLLAPTSRPTEQAAESTQVSLLSPSRRLLLDSFPLELTALSLSSSCRRGCSKRLLPSTTTRTMTTRRRIRQSSTTRPGASAPVTSTWKVSSTYSFSLPFPSSDPHDFELTSHFYPLLLQMSFEMRLDEAQCPRATNHLDPNFPEFDSSSRSLNGSTFDSTSGHSLSRSTSTPYLPLESEHQPFSPSPLDLEADPLAFFVFISRSRQTLLLWHLGRVRVRSPRAGFRGTR